MVKLPAEPLRQPSTALPFSLPEWEVAEVSGCCDCGMVELGLEVLGLEVLGLVLLGFCALGCVLLGFCVLSGDDGLV